MLDGRVWDETIVHTQKPLEIAKHPERIVSQILVQPDANLVSTERVEVPFYLGVVESLLSVIPAGAPTILPTCLFHLQGFDEASEGFTTDLYAVQKIRVRSLCRIASMAMSLGRV